MRYNQLGKSDLRVSEIGLGCMSIKYLGQGKKIIQKALDYGVNFFDTADLYDKGVNEEIVGKVLKEKRQDVIIATKVGNQWRDDGSGWEWNPTKSYIKSAVHQSLRRLQTDYIDLYQLHGGTIDDPMDETIQAFEELKTEGLIRAYGISSIRHNVIDAYLQKSNFTTNMMQYSLLDRRPEEWALDVLAKAEKSVVVRGALAKGLLASKVARAYLDHSEEEVQKVKDLLKEKSTAEIHTGHLALKYVLRHPAVGTIALGASSAEQLEESLKDFAQSKTISLDDIAAQIKASKYTAHRLR